MGMSSLQGLNPADRALLALFGRSGCFWHGGCLRLKVTENLFGDRVSMNQIRPQIKHTLTADQEEAFGSIRRFLADDRERCFLLKGYAGTGKSFLVGAVAVHLNSRKIPFALTASTGKAALMLSQRTNQEATTVHSQIYSFDKITESEDVKNSLLARFRLEKLVDFQKKMVLIVDEASMISNKNAHTEFLQYGSGSLLDDLVEYIRLQNPDMKTKIIFVGDTAQLPPINCDYSPALRADFLRRKYGVGCREFTLSEILRQKKGSGILGNASAIRSSIRKRDYVSFQIKKTFDVPKLYASDIPRLFSSPEALENTAVITFRNATALQQNIAVRRHILGGSGRQDVCAQDRLIVVQNNIKDKLCNGDFVSVVSADAKPEQRSIPLILKGGESTTVRLKFRDIKIRRTLKNGKKMDLTCKIFENNLFSPYRCATREEQVALTVDFKMRHPNLKPNTDKFNNELLDDPYYNALQVKFGYAITCHKAQGSEWENVAVIFEHSCTDNSEFFRWAYTAVTRAQKKLYVVTAPRFSAACGWSRRMYGGKPFEGEPRAHEFVMTGASE